MPKKILLLAYHFPPLNSVASSRTYAFARYLSALGNEVTVVTVDHRGDGCNLTVDAEDKFTVVPAMTVYNRNRNEDLLDEGRSKSLTESLANARFRLKKFIAYHVLGNLVTTADRWFFRGRTTAFQLLAREQFDVVISSFSPISSHVIALLVKTRFPRICWVADYRDLWSFNECVPRPLFPLSLVQRVTEKILNRRADLIVTVSEPLRNVLAEASGRPTYVVENGFFPEDERRGEGLSPGFSRRYTFSYTGSIYRNKQDPTPFFLALKEVVAEGGMARTEVDVRFYGDNSYLLRDKVRTLGLDDIVKLFPLVSRDESFAIQRHSTALIFLESDDPASRGVLTGKLFEYMIAGRPIIAVGISERHAAGKLITETGTGFVCGSDVTAIRKAISAVIDGTGLSPDVGKIAAFRRDRLVGKLNGIIAENCLVNRPNRVTEEA